MMSSRSDDPADHHRRPATWGRQFHLDAGRWGGSLPRLARRFAARSRRIRLGFDLGDRCPPGRAAAAHGPPKLQATQRAQQMLQPLGTSASWETFASAPQLASRSSSDIAFRLQAPVRSASGHPAGSSRSVRCGGRRKSVVYACTRDQYIDRGEPHRIHHRSEAALQQHQHQPAAVPIDPSARFERMPDNGSSAPRTPAPPDRADPCGSQGRVATSTRTPGGIEKPPMPAPPAAPASGVRPHRHAHQGTGQSDLDAGRSCRHRRAMRCHFPAVVIRGDRGRLGNERDEWRSQRISGKRQMPLASLPPPSEDLLRANLPSPCHLADRLHEGLDPTLPAPPSCRTRHDLDPVRVSLNVTIISAEDLRTVHVHPVSETRASGPRSGYQRHEDCAR